MLPERSISYIHTYIYIQLKFDSAALTKVAKWNSHQQIDFSKLLFATDPACLSFNVSSAKQVMWSIAFVWCSFVRLFVRVSEKPKKLWMDFDEISRLITNEYRTTRWVIITGPPSTKWQTSANVDQFSYFFTVKFRKNLRRNVDLKLPPPLKSVAALPCET